MEDLFETPEKIPHDIQKIIDKMNAELESGADMYKVMSKALIDCERITKVYSSGNEFNLLLKDKDVSYFYSDEEKHLLVYDNSLELLSHGREAENSLVDKMKKQQFELITSLTTIQAIKNKREYEKEN